MSFWSLFYLEEHALKTEWTTSIVDLTIKRGVNYDSKENGGFIEIYSGVYE
jgi:hypothetical protein